MSKFVVVVVVVVVVRQGPPGPEEEIGPGSTSTEGHLLPACLTYYLPTYPSLPTAPVVETKSEYMTRGGCPTRELDREND